MTLIHLFHLMMVGNKSGLTPGKARAPEQDS
jgi:hypothetical protein